MEKSNWYLTLLYSVLLLLRLLNCLCVCVVFILAILQHLFHLALNSKRGTAADLSKNPLRMLTKMFSLAHQLYFSNTGFG